MSWEPFKKVKRLPNGDIGAIGSYRVNNRERATYYRINSNGSPYGYTLLGDNAYPQSYCSAASLDMELLPDGSLYLAAFLQPDTLSILRTNINGTIANRYDIAGTNGQMGLSMYHSSDSLVVFTRDVYSPSQGTLLTSISTIGEINTYRINTNVTEVYHAEKGADYYIIQGKALSWMNMYKFDLSFNTMWTFELYTPGFNGHLGYRVSLETFTIGADGCIYTIGKVGGGTFVATKLMPNGQVSVDDEYAPQPQNRISAYPNPSNDIITIELSKTNESSNHDLEYSIFNIKGQKVRAIRAFENSKGRYEAYWDRRDNNGSLCKPGIYIIQCNLPNSCAAKVVIKK